jgi:hypothetical protein
VENSPKSWKSDKRRYQVCSTHRRTASQPIGREEEWSEEEGLVCGVGGQAHSSEARPHKGFVIRLMFGNKEVMEEESLLRKDCGRGKKLKVLAAKKFLATQREVGVSFPMKEGGIIEKLVVLEDKAVKIMASREMVRVSQ